MQVNKKILLVLTALLSILCSMTTKAGVEKCIVHADVVHCAYFSGLSENLNDGRFIKIQYGNSDTIINCFNGRITMLVDKDSAETSQPNHSNAYSICSDKAGRHCELFAVDNFVISKKNNVYVAEPKYFELDLSTLKNKYPACSPDVALVRT